MKVFLQIWRYKFRQVKNSIIFYRGSWFKVWVVTLFSLSFMVGMYILFWEGFNFLKILPLISTMVINRLLYIFFLLIFFLLIFSGLVVSYSTLFAKGELDFLFSLPLNYQTLFTIKFLESAFYASWAFLFIGFPFITAYGVFNRVPLFFYFLFLFNAVPFTLISISAGVLITLLLSRIMALKRWRIYIIGIGILLIPIFYLIYKFVSLPPLSPNVFTMVKQVFQHFRLSQYPYLPSFWISKVLFSYLQKDYANAIRYLLYLFGVCLFSCAFLFNLSKCFYFPAFSNSRGGVQVKKPLKKFNLWKVIEKLLFFLPSSWRGMVMKDIKTFLRDPRQWSQFLIFFGILGFYIVNLRYYRFIRLSMGFKLLVSMVNLAAMGFILCTLTIRFMYPQISLEGRRIWLLNLSKLDYAKIVWEKFLLTFFFSLIVVFSLINFTNYFLKNPPYFWAFSFFMIVMISLGVSALSVGLGAAYPDFSTDNPAKIVSSFGGTLNFVLSFIFILFLVSLNSIPFYLWLIDKSINKIKFLRFLRLTLLWSGAITFFAVFFPLKYGIKKISNIQM